jgi:DNA-binding response OmpR family regulator
MILVVEDNMLEQTLLEEALRGIGQTAIFAFSVKAGGEAYERFRDRIDGAIIDLRLTDGTGLDLVDHIRKQDHRIGLIIVTGLPQEIEGGLSEDADMVIMKPFRIAELQEACSHLGWQRSEDVPLH